MEPIFNLLNETSEDIVTQQREERPLRQEEAAGKRANDNAMVQVLEEIIELQLFPSFKHSFIHSRRKW